jgi:hypothetical protein
VFPNVLPDACIHCIQCVLEPRALGHHRHQLIHNGVHCHVILDAPAFMSGTSAHGAIRRHLGILFAQSQRPAADARRVALHHGSSNLMHIHRVQ